MTTSAASAYLDWLRLVRAGDLRGAWPATDSALRLHLATLWIDEPASGYAASTRSERERIATRLAKPHQPRHRAWDEFARRVIKVLLHNPESPTGGFAEVAPAALDEHLVAAAALGPNLERVAIRTGPERFDSPMLMRCVAGQWVVANFGLAERPPAIG